MYAAAGVGTGLLFMYTLDYRFAISTAFVTDVLLAYMASTAVGLALYLVAIRRCVSPLRLVVISLYFAAAWYAAFGFVRLKWQVVALVGVAGLLVGSSIAFTSLIVREFPLTKQGTIQGGLYLLNVLASGVGIAGFYGVYLLTDRRHAAASKAAHVELAWGACYWVAAAPASSRP